MTPPTNDQLTAWAEMAEVSILPPNVPAEYARVSLTDAGRAALKGDEQ